MDEHKYQIGDKVRFCMWDGTLLEGIIESTIPVHDGKEFKKGYKISVDGSPIIVQEFRITPNETN